MKSLNNPVPSILLIILLIGFPQISETIYTPALPNIANSLNTSGKLVQWTLSIYFIGFAFGVFYWGRLSDHIGRRPTMLLGLILYGFSSAGCLLSPTIYWLLLARLFQAFGASVGSVITQTMIREAFHGTARQKLFSLIGVALSLTPAIGPFIGGYVNDWFGWKANFLILVILSFILLLYSYMALPETKIKNNDAQKPAKLFDVAFSLCTDKRIIGCTWLVAAINGILFSYYAEGPFIFIRIIGLSPSQYGLLGIFIACAAILGSTISHRLTDYYSGEEIASFGCLLMLMSTICLSGFAFFNLIKNTHVFLSILLIMIPMAGTILGAFGLILPYVLSSALTNYQSVIGTAGACFGLAYYLLIAGLTWLMGLLHSGTILPMPLYFLGLSISIYISHEFLIKTKLK